MVIWWNQLELNTFWWNALIWNNSCKTLQRLFKVYRTVGCLSYNAHFHDKLWSYLSKYELTSQELIAPIWLNSQRSNWLPYMQVWNYVNITAFFWKKILKCGQKKYSQLYLVFVIIIYYAEKEGLMLYDVKCRS